MNFTRKKTYILIGLTVIVFIIGALGFFIRSVTQYMIVESKNALVEIASKSALVQESTIAARLDTLASLANLQTVKSSQILLEDKLDTIKQEAERNGFIWIGITDVDGNAITSDGYQFYVGDRDYFFRAMRGEKTLSNKLSDQIGATQQDILVYSVPIYDGKENIGTIFATSDLGHIFSFIYDANIGFGKDVLLVNKEGEVFAKKDQANFESIVIGTNFLQTIEENTDSTEFAYIAELIKENKMGGALCTIAGEEFVVGVHTLANTDNWNIVVLAPKDRLLKSTSYIVEFALVLILVLISFIMIAFLLMYVLNKKYLKEKDNVKLTVEKMQIKDSFIANVSHEIRTPINAINGITYFLKSTELSDAQKTQLEKIESAVEVLLGIINDILDVSKIAQGKLSLVKQPFSLTQVITSLDCIFSDKIRNKGLTWLIEKDFAEDIWVLGDKQRLNQIIINLVNNAYKFTDYGRICLKVEQVSMKDNLVTYLFTVEDTGIGIAKENLKKLFIPFEQLDNSLAKSYEGAGLGLSICDNLLRQMGSSFEVKSQIGRGSSFSFKLSFERSEPITEETPDLDQGTMLVAGTKILLVEDNEINAEIAGALLEEMGIAYDWAESGEMAIQFCKQSLGNEYQLILMDIQMPGMNGYSVANLLKTEYGITTPILALTAGLVDKNFLAAETNCMEDCILKPFNVNHFKKKIMQYLLRKNQKKN